MALTWGDDYPIHQTPEPVAYAGTDRNFYDRYFFNGYAPEGDGGDLFFAAAFGVYPHLNIADASFCVMKDGKQVNLHASRWLGMERMDLRVGPIAIEVLQPLQRLKLVVQAPEQGVAAEIVFEGRAFPIEEPRFIRRNGPRAFMDYTRLTQNGRYSGWVEVDGVRTTVEGFVGTRDRSWGVRPVGARDPQEPVPPVPPQFFWLWSPCNFADGSFFFHTNDDELGRPWNRRAVWLEDGGREEAFGGFAESSCAIRWKSGTRHASAANLNLGEGGSVTITPQTEFFMLGLGYTHPVWGHGHNQGALKVEREDFVLADIDRRMPHHLHVQALSRVTYVDGEGRSHVGRGVFEQLAIGPHAPSGFASILDLAP
ncbi:hypothetical protein EIB18_06610 [Caulobacter vibrioides]|uniref:hypothetical protein n=1 Tax=Caulobacter vibrioides TaxID=155892 RepID=UPI000BB48388|nr:hypothetical protein [Caulobacter vibrioides]ATC24169.1 hypothetical protein CA608_06340 [Caulobacter vibrioides]AZH12415.1 hypothetical protein EIB18_06610 [Caulobacter vibrioides]PLR08394.1 hypothetical protein CVUC_17405 [Caulobacter vibrioides]